MKNRIIYTIWFTVIIALSCGNERPKDTVEATQSTANIGAEIAESSNTEISLTPEERLGKRLFLLCTACHNLKEGEPHKVGPNLHGIFGMKAGLKEGFVYSDALKASSIVWNDEEMRAWIKNPTEYIPGTNMAFIGLTKEKQQDALIAYLKVGTK